MKEFVCHGKALILGQRAPEAPRCPRRGVGLGSLEACRGHLQSPRSSASRPAVGDAGESKSSTSHR